MREVAEGAYVFRWAWARGIEMPTLVVAIAVCGGYLALTWYFRDLPLWVAAPLSACWLTWFGSP